MSSFSKAYVDDIRTSVIKKDKDAFSILPEEMPAAPKTEAVAKAEPSKEESSFFSDVGAFIKEVPSQLVGGIYDAANNTIETVRDIGKSAGIPNMALQYTNEEGEFDVKLLSEKEVAAKGGLGKVLPEFDKADTAAGGMVRAISTFAAGFIPAGMAVKGAIKGAGLAGSVGRGAAAGSIADAVVMDPHQARLATMLNEVPVLGAVIPDYMADNDPANESVWEGRIKNVIEGAALGVISEAAVGGAVKMFKGYKVAALAKKAQAIEAPLTPEAAVRQMDEVAEQTAQAVDDIVQPAPVDLGPKEVLGEAEGKVFINTKRINTEADVKKVMQNVADKSYDTLSKGGKTLEGIKEASKKEMKNVEDLLGRPTTRPFTAEEAVAARDLMTTSAENLTDLAQRATADMAGPEDLFEFRKALAVHEDIQTKVFGGRKATAQALNAWKIPSKSSASRGKAIAAALGNGGQDIQKMAKILSSVGASGKNVSATAAKLTSKTWADAHYQVWVNGLLSSPTTHAVNVMSNMGTSLMGIPERYMTAGIEKMMGVNGNAFKEANARAAGFFTGLNDGWQLMMGKTQNAAITASSKIERDIDAISGAAFGLQPESTIGSAIDFIGKAVNLPGRALEKGDNFFKGLNYRMMLNEQAHKKAFGEGLIGSSYKKRVAELVANPTEPIQDVASDFARYQTFTNEAGDFVQGVRKAVDTTKVGKYIMPFVRTPANIMRYGFERTPLAFAMSDVRTAMAAGGSQKAEAIARMASGTMLMGGAAGLTLGGSMTGGGPANWKEREVLERTGWQPYSVKMGDKYFSYERLEPIGSLMAYASDVTSIMGQIDEEESGELIAAGCAAFFKNLSSKTFLSGVTEFLGVVTSNSSAKWEKYTQKMGSGFIQPAFSSVAKKVNNYMDNTKRDYTPDDEMGYLRSMVARAGENIPGMGNTAPPLRDIWGEEMHYSNGVAPILENIAPIKFSEDKHDAINDMLADNMIVLSMPSRTMEGTKMTNKEFDKFTERAGKYARELTQDSMEAGDFEDASPGPDGEIALMMHSIFRRSRKIAKAEIIEETPNLEERIYANKLEMESKLTGEE